MGSKDEIKVLFDLDSNGYITGWQQEFYDGTNWIAPFDTANAVDLAQTEIDKIVLGASKLIDGEIVVDKAKQAEIEAEANKVVPTTEQQLIATLSLRLAQLEANS
ncbi:phage infection protein [Lacticaseibacillus jixiensis]|uniref:phage infection protein n=1 Tax=Lacticaseibacillus jixiensis TaxID=3231926 RepID=UPI0036F27D00